MYIYEVYKNKKLLCKAGREDLNHLSAILNTFCDKDIPDDMRHSINVGGYVSNGKTEKFPDWFAQESLQVGDEITIKLTEGELADPPKRERLD